MVDLSMETHEEKLGKGMLSRYISILKSFRAAI